MFWKMTVEDSAEAVRGEWQGRFVLHRHRDGDGPHLDLRLEQEGYLLGWRIDGVALEGEAWAAEKAPHPAHWLEHDGDAVRVDAGVYAWERRELDSGVLCLEGADGSVRRIQVMREASVPLRVMRAVRDAAAACSVDVSMAAGLVVDGVTARRRAVERLCGLGRELDGSAFDEGVWRRTLSQLTLEEIHGQLRAYEARFDAKYPPLPVSRPERLPEAGRCDGAMAIVRGENG